MPDDKTIEELKAELAAEKKARAKAEDAAAKSKKEATSAKRAKTNAERKLEIAEKRTADALEAADAAEDEAAAARRTADDLDPVDESEEEIVYVKMADCVPGLGHFRRTYSARYKEQTYSFSAGGVFPVPFGFVEYLLTVADRRVKGTPEGAKIFTVVDNPEG